MKIVLGIADLGLNIWDYISIHDIMVNNLILAKRYKRKILSRIKDRYKLTVWIDSGGYQIMIKGLKIGVDEVASRYREIPGDFFMSLDEPVFMPTSDQREIVDRNINNYYQLSKKLSDKLIIPVIHMYKSQFLAYALERYYEAGNKLIAYGGIVPPMMKMTRFRLLSLLGLIILKKLRQDLKIHVLGIGSYLMTRLLEELGTYSLDTSTWRIKAAFGHVIVPGMGERHVGNRRLRFRTPNIKEEELKLLYNELKRTKFPLLDEFHDLIKTFKGRAIINAWVITRSHNGISKRSSFLNLRRKLVKYMNMNLEELMKIYDEGLMNAAMGKPVNL